MYFTYDEIVKRFETWTRKCETLGEGSALCYAKSYFPGIIKKAVSPCFSVQIGWVPFDTLCQNKSLFGLRRQVITACEIAVEKMILNKDTTPAQRKTLRNYRSGLRAFFRFMEEENIYFVKPCKAIQDNLKSFVESNTCEIKYSYDELSVIFKSRLVTQDRAYHHMLYCARIINSIFNNSAAKGDYDKVMQDAIDIIKLVVSDSGRTILFRDVSAIYIKPSVSVTIVSKGTIYTMYTRNPDGRYIPFVALNAEDLSIDHDDAICTILDNEKAQDLYPCLKQISDAYAYPYTKDYLKCPDVRNFKQKSGKCFQDNKAAFLDPAFVTDLLKEFTSLYQNYITFTLMYGKFNSSKGKK